MVSRPAFEPSANTERADNDSTLAIAAIDDPHRFADLYDRYADGVYRFVLGQTGSPAVADDLTSETMVRAMESLHRFDPERGSFAGWLFAIARNQVRNHFRAHRRMWRAISRLWDPDSEEDALTGIVNREDADRVRSALAQVSDSDKEILLLRYSGGLTGQQIAEVLGISDEAARTRLSRARNRVADILGASDE